MKRVLSSASFPCPASPPGRKTPKNLSTVPFKRKAHNPHRLLILNGLVEDTRGDDLAAPAKG